MAVWQGLADAFILLGLPFDSPEAQQLNKEIFEAIYFAGLRTSCQIAQKDGAPRCPSHHAFRGVVVQRRVSSISPNLKTPLFLFSVSVTAAVYWL